VVSLVSNNSFLSCTVSEITFSVYVTACNLTKSFSFDKTILKIEKNYASHVRFPIHTHILYLMHVIFPEVWELERL